MTTTSTASALSTLRSAADAVDGGWAPTHWQIIDEHGVARDFERTFTPGAISWIVGGIGELDLTPGERVAFQTTLAPPAVLHGVSLAGERLEATVRSLYPISIRVEGETLLSEAIPPVAAGPALIEVTDSIDPGRGLELELSILPLEGQHGGGVTWLDVVFTTPGLRRRFEALDLAWARLRLADRMAATAQQRQVVEVAARLVPAAPLELEPAQLDAALDRVAVALEPLAQAISSLDVHVVGHAHIDLAWLWTWNDTREVIKRDVRTVLSILADYPEATFTHSQPAGYEVIRTEAPELFPEILRLIGEGRWEPATAQWVESDSNLPSGEAMANQLLAGVDYSREYLGVSPRVLLAPDTFGHSANLPQLASSAGVQIYYHMRCNPGAARGRMWPAYWWEAIDGTRVFACSTASYNGRLTPGAIARAAIDGLDAGLSTSMLFIGVGDHGGGPTRQGYDTLRRVGTVPGMPTARCSTIEAYADRVLASGVPLPVHRGESGRIFEGCYTTRADVKKANRLAENRLGTAETLAALAGVDRDELAPEWRRLCFNQFHDIIAGSAIPAVYQAAHADYADVTQTASRITGHALDILTAGAESGSVSVVNPHARASTDIVSVESTVSAAVVIDEKGEVVPSQASAGEVRFLASVPAFGTTNYRLVSAADEPGPTNWSAVEEDPDYIRVRTRHLRAVVRRDCGIITSLVDARTGAELVAYGMRRPTDYGDPARPDLGLNVFQLVDEHPHFMSAWQYQEVGSETSLISGATTEVVETGPVRTVLRVRHTVRDSRITEDIVFYEELPRVDFEVEVDWQERGGGDVGIPNLHLSFTPDIDAAAAWFEVPHGAVRRRANGQQAPALRWVDIGSAEYGVALLNDSNYAHEVLGNRMRINLIRTAYMPDPRSDRGRHEFRFALMPHVGDWRDAHIPHAAALFNQPLVVRRHDRPARSVSAPRSWRPKVEVEGGLAGVTLRATRDGRYRVMRFAESSGRSPTVSVTGLSTNAVIWDSDVTEARRYQVGRGPEFGLRLRPWEVRTLVVEIGDAEPLDMH